MQNFATRSFGDAKISDRIDQLRGNVHDSINNRIL